MIINANDPLKISKKRVIAAASLLPVLNTLVAPIFPDPISLISPRLKSFVINNPNGILPIK